MEASFRFNNSGSALLIDVQGYWNRINTNATRLFFNQAAKVIRNNGWNVDILDQSHDRSIFADYIRNGRHDLVILNTTALLGDGGFNAACEMAKMVKEIGTAKIAYKGQTAVHYGEKIFGFCTAFDIAIFGEFVPIINDITTGKTLGTISGICFHNGSQMYTTGSRQLGDLDAHPFGDIVPMHGSARMLFSHGCAAACYFCTNDSISHGIVRKRNLKNVFEEIDSYVARGVRRFRFIDHNYFYYPDEACEIGKYIASRGGSWSCRARVETLTDSLCKNIGANNCEYVSVGIETFDPSLRNYLGKTGSFESIECGMRAAQRYGVGIEAYFIIGPTNDLTYVVRDAKFISCFNPEIISVGILTYCPGTELFKREKRIPKNTHNNLDVSEVFPEYPKHVVEYTRKVFKRRYYFRIRFQISLLRNKIFINNRHMRFNSILRTIFKRMAYLILSLFYRFLFLWLIDEYRLKSYNRIIFK